MPLLLQSQKLLLCGALCLQVASAQQVTNFPDLDLPTLGQRAESSMQTSPEEAIPYMVEIKGRLTMAMSEEFRSIYRENLYMLGLAHMRWFELTQNGEHLKAGIPYWDEFVQEFLSDKRHPLAMMNRADSKFGAELWGEAVEDYLHILGIYSRQLDDELLGLVQRLVVGADNAGNSEEIQPMLWRLIDTSFPYNVRLFCLNALFGEALEQDGLEDLMRLVAEINRDRGFRYDLGINLRLLNTGDRFEEDERYLEAGLLFSMVLPVEQLLYAVEDELISIEEQLFRGQFIASKESALINRLNELREQRQELLEAPKYTANLRWRQARVMRLMGRTYEAFFAFVRLIAEYPQHKHIEQFRYAAFLQGIECGYLDEAILIGEVYLDEPSYVLFEKAIATQLAKLYEANGDIEKLADLADEFLIRFPYEPVAAQMAHSLGHALFKKGDTERILEDFPYWVEEFPDGAFLESVEYWMGMAYLFTGDFESALASFENLIETNPGSIYFKEAQFRRGVSFFGLGEYPVAREIFTKWVAEAPGHPLQPEAHVFLGDLDAIDAEVESALSNYAKVELLGGSQAFVDHGYFESASLLIANRRFGEHDRLLEQYLERFPETSSAAEAVLRLAEANIERGRIREAFNYYEQGIEGFGNRSDADQVDMIIDAWWGADAIVRSEYGQTKEFIEKLLGDESFRSRILYNRVEQIGYFSENGQLSRALQNELTIRQPLYEALVKRTKQDQNNEGRALELEDYEGLSVYLDDAKAKFEQLPESLPKDYFTGLREKALSEGMAPLALRLWRVLNQRAGLEVSPEEVGPAEVEIASPASLVWLATIEAKTDPITARGILLQVVEEIPQSGVVGDALFELGRLEMELAYFDEAAEYFGRVLDEYFNNDHAKRAAILRADSYRNARRYEEAIDAYSLIINQREWRGELWAEATFKIGLCFLQLNEIGKAQGFFERTYLAYSGYPEWSGKAVLESGDLLESKGDVESAKNTYEFFLNSPTSAESPLLEVVNQRIRTF